MKPRWGLALLLVAGCATWHQLRPLTENNVEVGQLTLWVKNARYAESGGRLLLEVQLDNRTNQPQQFDTRWIELRGASGTLYQSETVRPPLTGSVAPLTRLPLSYVFRHIPPQELTQATMMVAGTATMEFGGFY